MKSGDLRLLLSRVGSRRLFLASAVAAATWSAIVILNAILIAEVIVRILGAKDATKFILALGALWLIRSMFSSRFERWCFFQAAQIKRNYRGEVTSKMAGGTAFSPAELSNLLTKGLNSLDIYLGRFIPQMLTAAIAPIVTIAVIFSRDAISGVIALLTLPLIPLFGALIGRYSADSVAKKWRTLGTLSQYFEDSLQGFATLKIFGRDKSQAERIKVMGDKYTDETMKVLKISFLSAFALELIATLSVAVIAVSVGLRLVSGSMDFTSALIILILAPDVYFPLRNAASLFHASEDGTQALKEIERILEPPSSKPISDFTYRSNYLNLIESVSWPAWDFQRQGNVLARIPAGRVKKGQILFITGESGIGKTTFANNLLGVSSDASIEFFDGVAESRLTPNLRESWQRVIGWIPQNPQLASGSVREQFQLLKVDISDSEIAKVLTNSGLNVDELPFGLDTPIGSGGEQGHSASGGQIRRIAVARALVRNPFIVIADEPTADLDAESATAVMKALRSAQESGAIVICITHDESLIGAGDLRCDVQAAPQ